MGAETSPFYFGKVPGERLSTAKFAGRNQSKVDPAGIDTKDRTMKS